MPTRQDETDHSTVDLRDILAALGRRKWYIVIPFVLTLSSAIGGSFLMESAYYSTTIMSYDNNPSLIKPLSGMVSQSGRGRMTSDDRRRQLAAMTNEILSSKVLSRLIRELRFDQNPQVEQEAQRIRSANPRMPLEKIKMELLIEKMRESIQVEFAGQRQLRLGVYDSDPVVAQQAASRLTDIYIEERTLQDLGAVRSAQELTDDQLSKYESQLQVALDKKTNAEKVYLQLQIDETIISEDNRKKIGAAIDEIASEISDLNRDEMTLVGKLKAVGKLTAPSSSNLRALKTQLGEDSRSLVNLMGKYVWSERVVLNGTIELNRKLIAVEKEVERLVDRNYADADASTRGDLRKYFVIMERLNFLHSHRASLKESFSSVQQRANEIPVAKALLDQIDREVTDARQNLALFKQQETSNQLRQDIIHSANSRYQIIEPAVAPLSPARPNRIKISIMGGILGIILGGAAALLRELMDGSFRKTSEVEDALGVPVLATIPNIESL
jgi:uncharacterized protein involved in exopolysaccharide biosynthesis